MLKKKILRGKVKSTGINMHDKVDNLITLYRSNNDLHIGVIDYLYFAILNCTPVEFYNLNEVAEEEDIDFLQEQFTKYDEGFLNETLKEQSCEFVKKIRECALNEGVITKSTISPCMFHPNVALFDGGYIVEKLFLYYKGGI